MSLLGGIDLGGTKIQAVVIGEDLQVLGEARVPTPTSGGPQDVADARVAAMREAAAGPREVNCPVSPAATAAVATPIALNLSVCGHG